MKGKENDTRSAISTDDLGNIAFSDIVVDPRSPYNPTFFITDNETMLHHSNPINAFKCCDCRFRGGYF